MILWFTEKWETIGRFEVRVTGSITSLVSQSSVCVRITWGASLKCRLLDPTQDILTQKIWDGARNLTFNKTSQVMRMQAAKKLPRTISAFSEAFFFFSLWNHRFSKSSQLFLFFSLFFQHRPLAVVVRSKAYKFGVYICDVFISQKMPVLTKSKWPGLRIIKDNRLQ